MIPVISGSAGWDEQYTGDQIYADSVAKNLTHSNGVNKTYEELLEDYRNIYRSPLQPSECILMLSVMC